jgi:uncharacterized membrane protein
MFIFAELAFFPLIQLTPGDVSAFWSYVAIVFVALYALFTFGSDPSTHFIRLGIGFTLLADYFLVLKSEELPGVLAFILVQAAYFVYLVLNEKRKRVRALNALSRILISAILVVAALLILGDGIDALAIASVIYYGNLIINAVFAFLLGRRERIFAIGLVLFAMCDLCIGLEVLFSSYLDSDALDFFYGANINLPWVFYQPSQVLIALRLYQRRDKSCEVIDK